MTVTAIVGANWGDEGKGKVTDVLAVKSSYVVRYQGGSNAGHTIINDFGKFALHMLPSGVFYPDVTNIIGPGTALDIGVLLSELEELSARGVPAPKLMISDRAQIVLPIHRLLDELEEQRLGSNSFGSTKRGIAPFYADKYLKVGIQAADLLDPLRLKNRLEHVLQSKNVLLQHFYGQPPIQAEAWMPELQEQAKRLAPYIGDTTSLLHKAYRRGENILLEGQLGALRDPDHGVYPFTTSSSTLAGYATVGAGLPPYAIEEIIAVTKAYSSCVGAGPFVSELYGEQAEELRKRGGDAGEYGVTTGRPRRVGWFDAVATRYGCRMQGATSVVLTNLDVLGYLDEIKVCVGYETTGGVMEEFPITSKLEGATPVFKTLPGWKCEISDVTDYDELPDAARQYIEWMESEIGVPIKTVSVGPRRDQVINR
ncbi:adenylosuccinate synthase [Paenibacillus glycanilyticus]|uniref:Adenylosuccinate synthetase n=1 Tax=Paenibacillus glycanilyticus TaxID=126569 RepID=A0ABQ6GJF0_9BACL|nr:adenylosuccinate synthase [Paenibacillus glycanilyticus]GLX70355.1 adenylosuccinate synthetase [Paenibacillus glycanilyticus]